MIWALLAFGCARPELPDADPAFDIEVSAVDAVDPARAAIEWFVPSLAGDVGVENLVARALAEAHRTHLDNRAAETRKDLSRIRRAIADRGLPDVFVGIPYVESRLHPEATSPQCAGGPWQFLPEVAVSQGLTVAGCTFAGADPADPLWSPGRVLPSRENRPYIGANGCRIASCERDDRRDLTRSTRAALAYLDASSTFPPIAASRHAVPLTVMSFNGGVGTVQKYLAATEPDDPFAILSECATGDCLVLPSETAWYLPRVVAAAAIVACNGSSPDDEALADWSRSDLCGTLHAAGLAPAPATARDVLIAAAGKGRTVGLASLDVAGFGMIDERQDIEQALADALGDIDGVSLILGVPGEDADALTAEGADVVINGEIGRRGDRVWLRLRSSDARRQVFSLIDVDTFDRSSATDLAADVLVGPLRDRSADAVERLVDARRAELTSCLPDARLGDRALVTVSIDGDGRASTLSVGPDRIDPEAATCIADRIAAMSFPRELAGAGATLEIGVEGPPLADAEEP